MQSVPLTLFAYASNISATLDVPAYVIGDLAIHRPASYDGSRRARLADRGWNVSHIPSGMAVNNARPAGLRHASLASLRTWAKRWQEIAAPEFATLRERKAIGPDRDLGQRLVNASRAAMGA